MVQPLTNWYSVVRFHCSVYGGCTSRCNSMTFNCGPVKLGEPSGLREVSCGKGVKIGNWLGSGRVGNGSERICACELLTIAVLSAKGGLLMVCSRPKGPIREKYKPNPPRSASWPFPNTSSPKPIRGSKSLSGWLL